jgi:hypothetical protein
MIFQLAFVLAQLHFHMNEGLIERAVSVLAFTFRFENSARVQMQGAVRTIEWPIVRENDIRLRATIKMLADAVSQTGSHAYRKRFANLNLLTRNPNPHGLLLLWPERALRPKSSAVFDTPRSKARVFRPAIGDCQRLQLAKGADGGFVH